MKQKIPSSRAVALHYSDEGAPRVTAKGGGELAQRIMEVAQQHNVPLFENPALVSVLSQLELGDEIPETLYTAVAQILAFAYHLKGKTQPHR